MREILQNQKLTPFDQHELIIVEEKTPPSDSTDYVERFEGIKKLTLIKGGVILELNSAEAKKLFNHLRLK